MNNVYQSVYILSGLRSFIGVENRMYKHIPAETLGASVLKQVTQNYPVQEIDAFIAGNAVGAGGNIARLTLLEAGLPTQIPAMTVDLQCGSGLESIAISAAKLSCGQADFIIAGGFESSSTAPRRAYHPNHPQYVPYGGENSWYKAAKFSPGPHLQTEMLLGAERTALAGGISRADLDPWVLRSHKYAVQARESGVLQKIQCEAIPGCTRDEGIRDRMNRRLLERLPCVLPDGQVTTAANACLTNDGAAFLALCNENFLQKHPYTPLAKVLDTVETGSDPSQSPRSAIAAIHKLLERNHLRAQDISIYECNEAFAVIDVLFARAFPDAVDRYNIYGGALAYGHPYGASGGIITLHALCALAQTDGRYAVCSVAAAGGVGTAILLERCSQCNKA